MKYSKFILTSVFAAMISSSAALADFPERTIENIFPWSAGKALSVSQIIAKAMGEELGVSLPVVSTPGAAGTKAFKTAMARPTDGLWDDGRTDEGQLGLKYHELEEAMNNLNSPNRAKYETIRKQNLHKMEPIPVCKIPN